MKRTVLILLLACLAMPEAARTQQTAEHPPLLIISIDGFMKSYMERTNTPNLDRLADAGVLAEAMIPVFPTKTFPTHYSMVTGLYTESHGVISNSFYDYELNAAFNYGPPPGGTDDSHWWGGEPIWVTAENQNKTAATLFWPGSDSEIQGVRPTRYLPYDGSVSNKARVDSIVSWMDPQGDVRADFGTLYFSDVDSRGHQYGPLAEETDQAAEEADMWIGYLLGLLEARGLADRVNLILVSDHGMAALSEEKVIFLDDIIRMEDVDMVDWTPVAMIRPDAGRRAEVYDALKENEIHYKVYLREDLPDEYRFRSHSRIPDIIMIADVGYTITTRPFFYSRGLPEGMHGYDHRAPEMSAFFLAAGPSFKNGLKIKPFSSIHLYELMSYLIGVEPALNEGSLDSLQHIIH